MLIMSTVTARYPGLILVLCEDLLQAARTDRLLKCSSLARNCIGKYARLVNKRTTHRLEYVTQNRSTVQLENPQQ
jgi:hypothetical protein